MTHEYNTRSFKVVDTVSITQEDLARLDLFVLPTGKIAIIFLKIKRNLQN